jgi:hypothetical protein
MNQNATSNGNTDDATRNEPYMLAAPYLTIA